MMARNKRLKCEIQNVYQTKFDGAKNVDFI